MLGLYFHWPFCLSKCIYCDFGSKVINKADCYDDEFQNKYFEYCINQLSYFKDKIATISPITTIYFGGGTPSLIKPKNIENFLKHVDKIFKIHKTCEITLEANPTSFEIEKFKDFKKIGINRISLGCQSMNDKNLLWLGRKHSVKQAIYAIEETKKLFKKWSFDLIYCLPKQSLNEWIVELKQALSLKPSHLSLYTLIIDDNTPLGKMVKLGNIKPKTDDENAIFYKATNDFISSNSNLLQYEVSNYALLNNESKHNLNYWYSYDYIGIGAGAHGRLLYKDGNRYEIQNFLDPKEWYINFINNNGLQIENVINTREQVEEIFIMGLRTKYGINFDDIKIRFNIDLHNFLNNDKLTFFANNGFLTFTKNNLILTKKGLIVLDEVVRNILI